MNMADHKNQIYDVCIIGGGINGAGIARDCAGRGLKTCLFDAGDFGGATSSASSKLVHGGLRYLEFYEFGLVRKALKERDILLNMAPHIIWPLDFILPYQDHLRPKWMLRIGLFLYDLLAHGTTLAKSKKIHLSGVLKKHIKDGFQYTDCWVDDARLVILNICSAAQKGASVHRNNAVQTVHKQPDGLFHITLASGAQILSRTVVNAAGPWANDFLPHGKSVKLVKGSHIVVPRLFNHDKAYILQNEDGRIVFALPYEDHYTLIGTTDVAFDGDPRHIDISESEKDYLVEITNQYFAHQIGHKDIVWTYAGVRPLIDDGNKNASKVTRDYSFDFNKGFLHVRGGKLTTYRVLAEEATQTLCRYLKHDSEQWTHNEPLPGGKIDDIDHFCDSVLAQYSQHDSDMISRMVFLYGTHIHDILRDIGKEIAPGVFSAEIDYLMTHEYAQTADDILWRRTKLGLHLKPEDQHKIADYINKKQGR